MNFIYDHGERIKQLENYMQDITDEFMEFSSEVALRLKERVKENESRPRKIKKITKYPDTKDLENSARHNFLENLEKKMFYTPASHLFIFDEKKLGNSYEVSLDDSLGKGDKACLPWPVTRKRHAA
ncbi:hypothetical protein Tco_0340881 [Tanacetum coccineum]